MLPDGEALARARKGGQGAVRRGERNSLDWLPWRRTEERRQVQGTPPPKSQTFRLLPLPWGTNNKFRPKRNGSKGVSVGIPESQVHIFKPSTEDRLLPVFFPPPPPSLSVTS